MAFPPYFYKNLQSAASLLQDIDADAFKGVLSANPVGIAFDRAAAGSPEGLKTLDVLIRLLARVYPSISLLPIGRPPARLISDLEALAKRVNPNLELYRSVDVKYCIVVGD